ncbi:MAG: serine hydrolase domain-containing protein [Bacteroidota bacterium]
MASEATYGKEQLFAELAKFKLTRKPGTKYAYSNTGAELIGYVLETVYQKSIESLLQTYLLEKCGMDNTAIALNERQQAQLIQGYWLDNDTPSPNFINNLWSTGSGVKSTLGDLMKYIEFQLSKDDPTLKLSHETLYDEGNGNHLAYLWNVSTDRYGRYYDHHGGTGGMQNWIFVFPKYQLGISILTNHSGLATPKRLSKAARMILKEVVLD